MLRRLVRTLVLVALAWVGWRIAMTRERAADLTVAFALRHRLDWLIMAAQLGGADVDRQTWPRLPALYGEISEENPETIRLLLRHGARPRLEVQDEYTFARHENLRLCGAPCLRVLADFGYVVSGE